MPTVLRWRGYRFFFYASDLGEPPHIHVVKDECAAKFWLIYLELAVYIGFKAHELNEIHAKPKEEQHALLEAWDEFFRT
jgi:hypothetical protein